MAGDDFSGARRILPCCPPPPPPRCAPRGPSSAARLSRADDLPSSHSASRQGAGGGEPRLWFLTLYADDRYPISPPAIKFGSRISADFVDGRGAVTAARVPYLASWNPSKTMMGALTEIKTLIHRSSRSQPAEGSTFP